jgi:hypothetical protein
MRPAWTVCAGIAPSSRAIRRKSGAGDSRFAKAYPDIATGGILGARSWNILIDSKPRTCGMKMSTIVRSKMLFPSARSPVSPAKKMPAISRLPNRLLQGRPTAEFLSLHPRLEAVELANEAVLVEAGAPVQQVYLPHSGAVAMIVSPSQGQAVGVAMVGRDSVVAVSRSPR